MNKKFALTLWYLFILALSVYINICGMKVMLHSGIEFFVSGFIACITAGYMLGRQIGKLFFLYKED